MDEVGRLPVDRFQFHGARLVQSRHRTEKPKGIRMLRAMIDVRAYAAFDDLTGIHDDDMLDMSATTPRSWVMRMMDMPSLSLSSAISSRICAWIVTSRAVVGSSAMRSLGSQARAMAIMTRWRMPPENSWGYGGGDVRRAPRSLTRSRSLMASIWKSLGG